MCYAEIHWWKGVIREKISARRHGCAHNRVAPRQAFGLQVALKAYGAVRHVRGEVRHVRGELRPSLSLACR